MASLNDTSLSREQLKNILNLYRICFEAVLNVYKAPPVNEFRRSKLDPPTWEIQYGEDRNNLPRTLLDTEVDVMVAYGYWHLCDHFCLFLLEPLRKHLRKYGFEVTWDVVEIKPVLLLKEAGHEPKLNLHSILTIWREGKMLFHFDGTRAQFGLSEADWLIEPKELNKLLVDEEEEWDDGTEGIEGLQAHIMGQDNGFWRRVFRSFNALFEELEEQQMGETYNVSIEEYVEVKAEDLAEEAAEETWGS